IRDKLVTGVQTCALPICQAAQLGEAEDDDEACVGAQVRQIPAQCEESQRGFHYPPSRGASLLYKTALSVRGDASLLYKTALSGRSEERRVGKEGRARGRG